MTAVKNWAIANNKPFLFWHEQQQTILDYLTFLKSEK